MGTFSFFPWVSMKEPMVFNNIELYPYLIGSNAYGIGNTVDSYLRAYESFPGRPIEKALILKFKNKEFFDELDQGERNEIFAFTEIAAFSSLALRQFFNQLGYYTNYDSLKCIIQMIQPGQSSVAVRSRRRDGGKLAGFTAKTFKVICPFHVSAGTLIDFDHGLMNSLLESWKNGNFEKYNLSIFNFDCANTDSDLVTPYVELVLTCSAFERLFEIDSASESKFAKKFLKLLEVQTENKCPEKRNVWIRDFFQTRNQLAHGKTKSLMKSKWPINEHLLLATYIFPILVKISLQNDKCYVLTDDDRFDIYLFDLLIKCSGLFKEVNNDYSWNKIRSNATWSWIMDKRKYIN